LQGTTKLKRSKISNFSQISAFHSILPYVTESQQTLSTDAKELEKKEKHMLRPCLMIWKKQTDKLLQQKHHACTITSRNTTSLIQDWI